jgi:pyruvate carboxylase
MAILGISSTFILFDSTNLSFYSVVPSRYFLGRPDVGEEMHISIESGKTLIIRLMAVGPVVEGRAQRDVWFEVNGEVKFRSLHSLFSMSANMVLLGPRSFY